jgi:hypothetical protein
VLMGLCAHGSKVGVFQPVLFRIIYEMNRRFSVQSELIFLPALLCPTGDVFFQVRVIDSVLVFLRRVVQIV